MTEEWRPIPGLLNYQASSEGRIMRVVGGLGARAGRIITGSSSKGGAVAYVGAKIPHMLRPRGKTQSLRPRVPVARLVCTAFHGKPPHPDCVASFRDNNPANLRADNLHWVVWKPFDRAKYMRGLRARKREQGV